MATFDCFSEHAAALSTALQVEPCLSSMGPPAAGVLCPQPCLDCSTLANVCPVSTELLMCLRVYPVNRGLRSTAALQELADMSTFNPAYGSRTPTYGSGPESPSSVNTTQPLNGPGMDAKIDGHLVVSQTVKMHLREVSHLQ